jgi:Na+-transporting NADH:ubiquinone oxidoreductase subunit NqrF
MPTNHFITLRAAIALTSSYRAKSEALLDTPYQGNDTLAQAETFDRSAIDKLLQQSDCQGIRIYFGLGNDSKVHSVLVGVNSRNEDILPEDMDTLSDQIVENGDRTPPMQIPASQLNS